jgi:hypothetical protein
MSKAFPKKVQMNGRVRIQTPPIIVYSQKKAITEIIKRNQYKAVDFFVSSMIRIFNENRSNELISKVVLFSHRDF